MEKRMLFMDLDGTLLDDRKQITPGNRRALEKTLERGHGVIITTGRPLKSAMDQARKLGLDKPGCFLIAYNGALIYDWEKGGQIFARTLDFPTVQEIFDYVNPQGFHLQTYDTWQVLVEPRCDNAIVREYCDRIIMDFRVIGDVHRDLRQEPVKILIIEPEDRAGIVALQRQIESRWAGKVDTFFSNPTYLEVVPAGMNKGQAVKMLCGLLGVPIGNAVAVGDEANDRSMIEAAGIGVAMANGTEEVKAVANYVTACDNNHDGIAEVVDRFFPEPVCGTDSINPKDF